MTFTASDFEGIESNITSVLLDNHGNGKVMIGCDYGNDGEFDYDNDFILCDLSDNTEWEEIGQSIGRSTVLRELRFDEFDDDFPPQWASSIAAFFNGLKHNTSLEELEMAFSPGNGVPDFDLGHFVANNKQLRCLSIVSCLPLLSDQGRMIASSIGTSSSLKRIDLKTAEFEHDDSFRQILSACSNIEELCSGCNHIYKCNAIADLLRNPETKLKWLHVSGKYAEGGMAIIAEGLKVNKSLKKLSHYVGGPDETDERNKSLGRALCESLGQALCDASSIESIQNSNHTLENVTISYLQTYLSEFVRDCLKLNKIKDKDQVIRQKIAKYRLYYRIREHL